MAYVSQALSAGGAQTLTINYSADENDFMFLLDTRQYGSVATPSGWTPLSYNKNSSGGGQSEIFYRRATASEPTSVSTVHSSTNKRHGLQLIICKGVDTTTAFDVTPTSKASGVPYDVIPVPSITPTNSNCLLLHLIVPHAYYVASEAGPMKIQKTGTGYGIAASYYSYSKAAGVATDTFDVLFGTNVSRVAVAVTIALRDDGNDYRKAFVDLSSKPADTLHLMYNGGTTGHLTGTAKVDTTSVITDYQGYTPVYNAIAAGAGGFEEGFANHGIGTSNATTTADILQTTSTVTSPYDLSSSLISLTSGGELDLFDTFADRAKGFSIGDGTNFRTWRIDAKDTKPTGSKSPISVVVEVDGGFESQADVGTVNLASIDNFVLQNYGNTTYRNCDYGFVYKLNTMRILGGSTTFPASLSVGAECAENASLRTVANQNQSSEAQYFCGQSIQVGDGTVVTTWDSNLHSIEFPAASDEANRRIQYQVAAGTFDFTLYASATCNFDFRSTFLMGNFHNWTIHASSSTAATYNENGCTIISGNVTLKDIGRALSGMSFIGCKELTTSGADLSGGCVIDGAVDAQAITVTSEADFAKLANCTFRNNTVAIKITGNQTGVWSDPNLTVSGNTYDIEYTGTTNFSIQSANTLTVNNSSSGVLSFVTPTFDLTVNSSESASQINVFTTTTQTIIAIEASNTQLVYTHASETVDITVLKDGYIPFRQTGVVLSGTVTIDVQLVKSREYLSTHGLTYTTDASWATNQLTVPTYGVTGQQVFSLIMEAFKSQTALRNTAFNLQMDGANSLYLVNDAEGASDASIENLVDCGVAYINTAGTTTASWCGIKSVGTATGFTGEYQQVAGSGTTDARATGVFNQLVKMYGDISHGNFDYTDHLVMKYQPNGYREKRVDVLDSYGISALSPTLYIVAMQPVTIAAAVGDPALTLTITDHGATPVTWNTKDFSITVTADAADSGEDILRELNYNLSLDATYNGKDPFNWPEMVLEAGTAYETARGITEGGAGATLKGVRVIDGSGNPHPAFTRMQADDGTYYVVPITANISISNLPDDVGGGTELQIYNVTTATLVYSGDPAGTSYSDSYTDGDLAYASAGDTIRIRFAHANAGTSFEVGQTITVASSSGIVADGDNFIAADDVYATNGIDGSTVTKFTYTPVNDQFNLIINSNFTAAEMYAFYCYTLTTTDGIEGAYGAFVASDAGNYKNITAITSIYLDNETTASKRQTDTARIYRDDGAYPVLDPTTSGFGIDINWQNVVYVVTAGSGLTAPQAAELTAAAGASTFDPATDVVEGTETWTEAMRLVRANAAGKLAVSGTTVTMRDAADTKDRITATVDSDGQRTAVTTDAS